MTKAKVKRPKGKPKPPKNWQANELHEFLVQMQSYVYRLTVSGQDQVREVIDAVNSDFKVIQESMRQLGNQIDAIRVLHQHDLGAVDTMRRTALELLALTEKKARQGD